MDWFIIYIIVGLTIVIFCIGYLFGLNMNRELDRKYFEEYQKDMQILSGYQPKYEPYEIVPPKKGSNTIYQK